MIALIFGIAMLAGCQQTAKIEHLKAEGPHISLMLKPVEGSMENDSDTMDKTVVVLKQRLLSAIPKKSDQGLKPL